MYVIKKKRKRHGRAQDEGVTRKSQRNMKYVTSSRQLPVDRSVCDSSFSLHTCNIDWLTHVSFCYIRTVWGNRHHHIIIIFFLRSNHVLIEETVLCTLFQSQRPFRQFLFLLLKIIELLFHRLVNHLLIEPITCFFFLFFGSFLFLSSFTCFAQIESN